MNPQNISSSRAVSVAIPAFQRPGMWRGVLFVCAAAALFANMLSGGTARAGEFNEVLSPGSPAPAWFDLPGVDGKKHAMDPIGPGRQGELRRRE